MTDSVLDRLVDHAVTAATSNERLFAAAITPWWWATSWAAVLVGACFPPRSPLPA